jgi:hypothetical protein
MYESTGILHYSLPYKIMVEVDPSLGSYYRSLAPKIVKLNKPLYPPHISVLRKETPINIEAWNKHEGREITFSYQGVFNDEIYYWLEARSPALEEIRSELGLPLISGLTQSPDKRHRFHITIGNVKGK